MADIAASVLAKLKNKAKTSGISYQQCLQLFFQEEFLRRLAGSKYAENFILKGGLFIYTLTNFESRATVDVDFLMRGLNNDLARMDEIIEEILAVNTGNDFITFKAGKTEPIAVQRKYHGVSTQITGYIKNVRVPFNVDIGVGDVIVPKAQRRNIQTQLEGYDKPEILTYSLESTIAEKFDAILQRFELTGRMKDFYDIYYLSRTFDFDGLKLQTAIQETLRNRGTAYEKDSFDRVLALADDTDMQTKWRYFLKTLDNPEIDFSEVMGGIKQFLEPIWEAIISEDQLIREWKATQMQWDRSFQKTVKKQAAIDKKLCDTAIALSKFAEEVSFGKMVRFDDALLRFSNIITERAFKIDSCFKITTTKLTECLTQIDRTVLYATKAAAQQIDVSAVQTCLNRFKEIQGPVSVGAAAVLRDASTVIKMYQSSEIVGQMSRVLEQLTSVDTALLEKAREFDWSKVDIQDEVVTFEGKSYTLPELSNELDAQISVAVTNKVPLRERVETLKNKIWLLLMIINLILLLPDVPEKVEFYRDAVMQIQELYEACPQICYTIKERSIIREEPDSSAKRVFYLPYDSPLEILDNIPRWLKVKYTSEDGTEITGWISKISVEDDD